MRNALLLSVALLSSSCATTTTTSFLNDDVYAAHFAEAWTAYAALTAAEPPDRPTSRSRVQRVLHVEIAAPREAVFALFSDVHQHFGLHPLLRHVVTHDLIDLDTAVRERRFTAVEDVPIGFGVVLPVETHAVTRIDRARFRYTTESWTDPATITRQLFVFRDLGDGVTRVDETITFESTVLLIGTVVDGGATAHARFMSLAKQRLEQGGGA